jgi:hypothetical protein
MTPGRSSAEGFTFVETLVSMLVLALVLAAAAPFVRTAVRALWTLARDEVRLHEISRAYDAFRSACEDTIAPSWAPSADVAIQAAAATAGGAVGGGAGGFRVAFLGGDEDGVWSLRAGSDGLALETPRGRFDVQAAAARIERIESGGRVIGLGASFKSLGRTWNWKGYFGAAGY